MAVDPAIVAIFGEPPDDIDLTDSRVQQDNAVVIFILCLAVISVVLRFVARRVLRNSLMADDWVIILALVFICTTSGLSISGGFYGAGKHVWAISVTKLVTLFKVSSTPHSTVVRALTSQILYIYVMFGGASGTCIDTDTFFLALGIINMLNDIVVLLIPFPQIAKLQMNRRKKVAISGILAVGSFACVASIVRIYSVDQFTKRTDVTWTLGPVFIWSTIEPGLSLVCACLPHLAPLVRLAHIKLSSSQDSKRSRPTNPSTPWRSRSGNANGNGTPSAGRRVHSVLSTKYTFDGQDDEEIGLTNHVTTSASLRKPHSIESVEREGGGSVDQSIMVHSSFVQSVSNK
ncbi:Oxidoreductase family, NAD-binding Rossmann fold protein [Aspergillus niger]|uniref:Oxidoreductase family, NAD-binding Rossmann fold protein n=1 Tax=Aspergillus niger TaxID=5061 RepID=A0A505HUM5_ASPNG|nr:Oxidoreductase family, NAD-binding Rossmann fold protein [Aspergillus niger]